MTDTFCAKPLGGESSSAALTAILLGVSVNMTKTMELDLQPILHGNLVAMRPLTADDFDLLYAAASDRLIWEQHPEPTRYQPEMFQRYFEKIMSSRGALAILETDSGKIIGSSSFYNYDLAQSQVSVGYTFLERAFWGGSYNREVKSLMLDHAFRSVRRVVFEVGARNVRSQKALHKIGASFLHETNLPGLDGTPMPYVVFFIDK